MKTKIHQTIAVYSNSFQQNRLIFLEEAQRIDGPIIKKNDHAKKAGEAIAEGLQQAKDSNDQEKIVEKLAQENKKLEKLYTEAIERFEVADLSKIPIDTIKSILLFSKEMRNGNLVARAISENQTAPAELLREIAYPDYKTILDWGGVLSNPNTPIDILRKYAEDKPEYMNSISNYGYSIRTNVARNPSTPSDILAKFIKDFSPHVRAHVAHNKNLTPELLREIYNTLSQKEKAHPNEDWSTISALLQHPKLPQDIRKKLRTEYPELQHLKEK